MAEKTTIIQLTGVNIELRNKFKAVCALGNCTLKAGILRLMEQAVEHQTLELSTKR